MTALGWLDPDDTERLMSTLGSWRDAERWHAAMARHLADVEIPLLARAVQRRGKTRGDIADRLGISRSRVDQILRIGKAWEDGRIELPPPAWAVTADVPPAGYDPVHEVIRVAPPPSTSGY